MKHWLDLHNVKQDGTYFIYDDIKQRYYQMHYCRIDIPKIDVTDIYDWKTICKTGVMNYDK